MASIRKQSLLTSMLTYLGFGIGFLNVMFLFPHFFEKEEFGLTRVFADLAQSVLAFSMVGIAALHRFFPYYDAHLPAKRNDLFSWVFLATVGLSIPATLGVMFFYLGRNENPLLQDYAHLLPIMALGLVYFGIFEAYFIVLRRPVLPSFLREVGLRSFQMLLIFGYASTWLDFGLFMLLFAFSYVFLLLVLLFELYRTGRLYFTLKPSKLSKRLWKPALFFTSFSYLWYLLSVLTPTLDGLIIANYVGLSAVGIFSLADYVSRLLLVPQRSISSATLGSLGALWRKRNLVKIQEIYSKSALLQLLAGCFLLANIWLHLDWGLTLLPQGYEAVKEPLFWLLMAKIVELGFGATTEIIYTSPFWRYNVYAYLLLFCISLPLNLFLVQRYGILGSAIAGLISFFIFNTWRFVLIWIKVGLQPFSWRNFAILGLAALCFLPAAWLDLPQNLGFNLFRSLIFSIPFLGLCYVFKISEDLNFFAHKLLGFLGRKV